MSPQQRSRTGSGRPSAGLPSRLGRSLLLLLPVALLLACSARVPSESARLLWLGALVQGAGALLALWTRQYGREPLGPPAIMLYVLALGWLLCAAPGQKDWVLYVAQALLSVVPVVLFGTQSLRDSGAATMRRARQLAGRLRARREWPADLTQVRALPEVEALREALHIDASPALELLADQRPAVRIAALAALEYRPNWRVGQPQLVLQLARRAAEPEVRAAAVNALANVEDRALVEALGDLLRDPSPLVRTTATEAVLWNSEQRWNWVRHHVHQALSDPALNEDGPLKLSEQTLPREVIEDWHSWCAEKGAVGQRAAMTLGVYYGQLLQAGSSPDLLARLRGEVVAPQTAPMLRLELTQLLHRLRELRPEELRVLLAQTMPAPVRLIAAEALLALGNSPEAVQALHDLARLPNRELALATADVVQKRLGVDLGMSRGQAPPVQSRAAAEVARRLMLWANQHDVEDSMPRPAPPSSRVHLG